MEKQTGAMDFSELEKFIVTVKGQNVIIDSDVARIYGTETREINKAIKNNPGKFPTGYIIEADKGELVENFHRFKNLKHSTVQPKAFTEKGLYMLATILKSPQATAATIAINEERKNLRYATFLLFSLLFFIFSFVLAASPYPKYFLPRYHWG
jgi:hypothetical protein